MNGANPYRIDFLLAQQSPRLAECRACVNRKAQTNNREACDAPGRPEMKRHGKFPL